MCVYIHLYIHMYTCMNILFINKSQIVISIVKYNTFKHELIIAYCSLIITYCSLIIASLL